MFSYNFIDDLFGRVINHAFPMNNITSTQTLNPMRAQPAAAGMASVAMIVGIVTTPTTPATETGYSLCLNDSKQLIR
jgi:hypothetical protein